MLFFILPKCVLPPLSDAITDLMGSAGLPIRPKGWSSQLWPTSPSDADSSHQVELAFQEAGADVTRYQIDLQNKPEWYASRVNPASKVGCASL
jgi:hypothetical protein